MIKIKDNIDLELLQNFGYHELEKVYAKVIPIYKGSGNAVLIKISKTNRNIKATGTAYGTILNEGTIRKYIADLFDNNLIQNQRRR